MRPNFRGGRVRACVQKCRVTGGSCVTGAPVTHGLPGRIIRPPLRGCAGHGPEAAEGTGPDHPGL